MNPKNSQIIATMVVAGVVAFTIGCAAGSVINYFSGSLKLNLKSSTK